MPERLWIGREIGPANREGERIRSVTWSEVGGQRQQAAHHPGNLLLARESIAAHMRLDRGGRESRNREAGLGCREKGGAPCLTEGQRATHVLGLVDALDRDAFGRVLRDDRGKASKDSEEAGLEGSLGWRTDDAEVDDAVFSLWAGIDDAKTGGDEARVNAKNDQGEGLGVGSAGGVEVGPDVLDIIVVFHGVN